MRLRLIALVGATSSLVLVAFLVPLALLVRSVAVDRAVSSAVVDVQAIAPTVATSDGAGLADAVDAANTDAAHPITVFLPDGSVLGPPAARSAAVLAAEHGQSLTVEVPGGREIVVAVVGLPTGTAVIRTFVSDAQLGAGVGRSWLLLALLGLGLLAVSLLVADRLARTLTRPLAAVADASYQIANGTLTARALDAGPPEVRQVSAGLNYLAARITELLAQERATVADLSHRLRTPLTALRIDAESVPDPGHRGRLMADLDALDRTVDDIIREADRPAREGVVVASNATAVVGERAHFWSVLADEQGRRLTVRLPQRPITVRLSGDDLSACVDALVGNVFAHTAEGVAFHVGLSPAADGGAILLVCDDGKGIADAPAVERGVSGGGSTGLGLDIVARSAGRSGGSMTLGRAPSGGAAITVHFGPAELPVIRRHRRGRR